MLMHRAPRSARLAVHGAFVLASASLLLPAAAKAESERPCASTDDSAPSGLIVERPVSNSPQQDRALDEQALQNPFISGVAFQINWRDIESVQGNPDWSKLDELFAAAESSKKWVHLTIFPGFFPRHGRWTASRPKSSQFRMDLAEGKWGSCRYHGTAST